MKKIHPTLFYSIQLIFFFSILLFKPSNLFATHVMGNELTYTCVGTNQYSLSLTAYRDCAGISMPNTLTVSWVDNNSMSGTITLTVASQIDVTPPFLTPSNCNGGAGTIGVEAHTYVGVVTLPPGGTNVTFSYNVCCRALGLTSIMNGSGTYLTAEVAATTPCNNSPDFANLPLFFSCLNQPITYNPGGFDIDGDSLVYSLTSCFANPGSPVNYYAGFSGTSPLGVTTPISVNAATGEISFTPTQVAATPICILVEEYRNGVLIGSVTRDVLYQVLPNCNNPSNTSLITGTIYEDVNGNCTQDSSERVFSGRLVKLNPGGYYTTTSINGSYSFYGFSAGTYTIEPVLDSFLWSSNCLNSFMDTAIITSNTDTISDKDFGIVVNNPCSDVSIDLVTQNLRPCFSTNNLYVHYRNNSYANQSLDSAYIIVRLDTALSVLSASIPWSSVSGNDYTFYIGNLVPGAQGTFSINCFLSCETAIGRTLCSSVEILPLDSCSVLRNQQYPKIDAPCTATWDQSSLVVEGNCVNDSVVCFKISNAGLTGIGDMECFQDIRVFVDTGLYLIDSLKLDGGDSLLMCFPANGYTWRLEVDQHPRHPGNSRPNAMIEYCGDSAAIANNWTLGILNQYPLDDLNHNYDIDCRMTSASFDPNDKRGFPLGVTTAHIIAANTDLEYIIRFQNTGTDTAFTVVIEDSLPDELDLLSVLPGASSHPYTFDIKGNGILEWRFENIMLPDSNVNEPASHGFVSFKVKQKADLPNGTYIRNEAAIFFDVNAPVITEQSEHLIGDNNFMFVITDVIELKEIDEADWAINVFPNPTNQKVTVLSDVRINELQLLSMTGQVILSREPTARSVELDLGQLPMGMYLLVVNSDKGLLNKRVLKVK